jgi:hypothetical protein
MSRVNEALYLVFILCRQNKNGKVVLKKLVKLTPVVYFINILQAAFAPNSFWQILQSQTEST